MSEVYSNDQIAEIFGVEPGTVRGWKCKNPNQFLENVHWFNQDNAVFWTQSGFLALQAFRNTIKTKPIPGTQPGTPGTETVPDVEPGTLSLERYRPMVNWMARLIVPQLLPELDQQVAQGFFQAAATPMTSEECVAVLIELGLPPINLAALADGSIAGLLQQQQEN